MSGEAEAEAEAEAAARGEAGGEGAVVGGGEEEDGAARVARELELMRAMGLPSAFVRAGPLNEWDAEQRRKEQRAASSQRRGKKRKKKRAREEETAAKRGRKGPPVPVWDRFTFHSQWYEAATVEGGAAAGHEKPDERTGEEEEEEEEGAVEQEQQQEQEKKQGGKGKEHVEVHLRAPFEEYQAVYARWEAARAQELGPALAARPATGADEAACAAAGEMSISYWRRRYEMFVHFDAGVMLDPVGWYSVTPEPVAAHVAERMRSGVVVDAFCGVGGNAIQLAFTCERVIAVDIDPLRVQMARHNAAVYGVEDRIEFVVGDFFELSRGLRADAVFLSPPWGGPGYARAGGYRLAGVPVPGGGRGLLEAARRVSPCVALFLPRSTRRADLEAATPPGQTCEVEWAYRYDRVLAMTVYFGDLVAAPPAREEEGGDGDGGGGERGAPPGSAYAAGGGGGGGGE